MGVQARKLGGVSSYPGVCSVSIHCEDGSATAGLQVRGYFVSPRCFALHHDPPALGWKAQPPSQHPRRSTLEALSIGYVRTAAGTAKEGGTPYRYSGNCTVYSSQPVPPASDHLANPCFQAHGRFSRTGGSLRKWRFRSW